jgi:hypothetical protein
LFLAPTAALQAQAHSHTLLLIPDRGDFDLGIPSLRILQTTSEFDLYFEPAKNLELD